MMERPELKKTWGFWFEQLLWSTAPHIRMDGSEEGAEAWRGMGVRGTSVLSS